MENNTTSERIKDVLIADLWIAVGHAKRVFISLGTVIDLRSRFQRAIVLLPSRINRQFYSTIKI